MAFFICQLKGPCMVIGSSTGFVGSLFVIDEICIAGGIKPPFKPTLGKSLRLITDSVGLTQPGISLMDNQCKLDDIKIKKKFKTIEELQGSLNDMDPKLSIEDNITIRAIKIEVLQSENKLANIMLDENEKKINAMRDRLKKLSLTYTK